MDYTIEFARVLCGSSLNAAFSLLSGSGADPTGRSRMPFARYKGEAEKALLAAGLSSVYLFRPAYIYPVEPRNEPNFSYRLLRAIYPAFSDAVSEPGDSSGRLGPGDGGCRRPENRSEGAWFSRTVISGPWSNRFIRPQGDPGLRLLERSNSGGSACMNLNTVCWQIGFKRERTAPAATVREIS